MTTDSASSPVGETYPIEYQEKAGSLFNAELRGAGTVTFDAAMGVWTFTGTQRRMLGRPTQVSFGVDQIFNVRVAGRRVQFEVRDGGKVRPFVFFRADEAGAWAVAQRLPRALDEDFVATRAFGDKLAQLPAAATPWQSPTMIIIGLNALVFVAMGFAGAGWFQAAEIMPYVRYGANNGAATTNGEWWRLVTSMFLHYGLLHLLFNMWALYQGGGLIEKLLGRVGFVIAYFGSGIAGSLATIAWNGDRVWSAGASGAVFGVYGMLGGYILRERRAIPRSVWGPLVKSTLWFAGYNLVFGAVHPGIDNAAHIGGLLSGVLFGAVLALPVEAAERPRLAGRRWAAGLGTLAGLLAVGVAATPRFNYTVADKLAWEATLKEPVARETIILQRQEEQITKWRHSGDGAELARWMRAEAIPFYATWAAELEALPLTLGSKTAEQRAVLLELVETKVRNLEQLIAGVEIGEADALRRFEAAESAMLERARAEKMRP